MAELINKTDTLNEGRVKLNEAIKDAEQAKGLSEQADDKATEALANSESTQTQLDTIVIDGDSSVEAAQARVSAEGTTYGTLKQRLDSEHASVTSQLAHNMEYTDSALGLLHSRKHGRKPLVSFIVDDGTIADYTKLKPIVEAKQVPLGLAIVTSWMNTNGYMNTQQITEMENLGCEILSHSHTHRDFATLTEEECHSEFEISKRILRENGFNPRLFVYPFNSTSEISRKVIRHYYEGGFAKTIFANSQMPGINTPNLRNREIGRNALGSYYDGQTDGFPQDTTSLEYYKALVDHAEEIGNWLVFVLHSDPMDSTQVQHFSDVIDYTRSKNIPIVSPSEGLETYGNIVEIEGEEGNFFINANGNLSSSNIYVSIERLNSRSGNDAVTTFPQPKITITPMTTSFATANNMPEDSGGYLITYRTSSEYYHARQIYLPITGSKKEYERFANSDYTWGDWSVVGNEGGVVRITPLNSFSVTNDWVDFPLGTITHTPISSTFANAEGFPSNQGGLLTTWRISSDYWVGKQEYKIGAVLHSSNIETVWERFVADSSGEWTPWRRKGELVFDIMSDPFTITANSTYDLEINNLDGVRFSSIVSIVPFESHSISAGIMFNIYRTLTDSIVVRFANLSSSDVTVDSIRWSINVKQKLR